MNAAPVPSSRDTALTIAADKGHCKFVDLLLRCSAFVDVRNKKGNSPLWLAANGESGRGREGIIYMTVCVCVLYRWSFGCDTITH